ncbi:MAG: hypothetical protein JWL73_2854 [Actinomycetia bacterium]|nr:hypothetical protein [Actinomycetes bacterium]
MTRQLPQTGGGWVELRAAQPAASAAFHRLIDFTWTMADPELLALCLTWAGTFLGCPEEASALVPEPTTEHAVQTRGAVADWSRQPGFTSLERACLSYFEQVEMDPSGVTQTQIDAILEHLSPAELLGFASAMYLLDAELRMHAVFGYSASGRPTRPDSGAQSLPTDTTGPRLAPPAQGARPDAAAYIQAYQPEYAAVLGAFGTEVCKLTAVDEVTKELVRLRNAQRQRCDLCMNLRRAGAVRDGLDEAMVAELARPGSVDEQFSERQRAAIALGDVFTGRDLLLTPELRAEIDRWFTAEQLAELAFSLVVWTGNRVLVALGIAFPVEPGKLTEFEYTRDGQQRYVASGG